MGFNYFEGGTGYTNQGGLGYVKGFKVEGIKETLDVFQQLADEIGDKKANSKVLRPALKEAMKPVLYTAKMLAPRDTHKLADSLISYVKRPTSKDKKSKYISASDTMVAFVEVKPISARERKEFRYTKASLAKKGINVTAKKFYEGKGRFYDARAVANEFGTAKRGAKPFLRPAMESQASNVVELLALLINQKIRQFRSKTAK